jgi:hypothetical protein
MMVTGLVLREVPLLCEDKRSACPARSPRVERLVPLLFPCCAGTRRGQASR